MLLVQGRNAVLHTQLHALPQHETQAGRLRQRTAAVRELDGVHGALLADNVGHVRHAGPRRGSQVQHLDNGPHLLSENAPGR